MQQKTVGPLFQCRLQMFTKEVGPGESDPIENRLGKIGREIIAAGCSDVDSAPAAKGSNGDVVNALAANKCLFEFIPCPFNGSLHSFGEKLTTCFKILDKHLIENVEPVIKKPAGGVDSLPHLLATLLIYFLLAPQHGLLCLNLLANLGKKRAKLAFDQAKMSFFAIGTNDYLHVFVNSRGFRLFDISASAK